MAQTPVCLYSAEQIAARVAELGGEIRRRFGDTRLTLLGILKGSAIFTADLARHVGEPAELSFVNARSYGRGTVSSGHVRLGQLEEEVLKDRTVVVADTILDTGRTLATVVDRVHEVGAYDVFTCVLLDKTARREIDLAPDLVGFAVPDKFLVGYGLDHAGRYRALPYIGCLGEDGQ